MKPPWGSPASSEGGITDTIRSPLALKCGFCDTILRAARFVPQAFIERLLQGCWWDHVQNTHETESASEELIVPWVNYGLG